MSEPAWARRRTDGQTAGPGAGPRARGRRCGRPPRLQPLPRLRGACVGLPAPVFPGVSKPRRAASPDPGLAHLAASGRREQAGARCFPPPSLRDPALGSPPPSCPLPPPGGCLFVFSSFFLLTLPTGNRLSHKNTRERPQRPLAPAQSRGGVPHSGPREAPPATGDSSRRGRRRGPPAPQPQASTAPPAPRPPSPAPRAASPARASPGDPPPARSWAPGPRARRGEPPATRVRRAHGGEGCGESMRADAPPPHFSGCTLLDIGIHPPVGNT